MREHGTQAGRFGHSHCFLVRVTELSLGKVLGDVRSLVGAPHVAGQTDVVETLQENTQRDVGGGEGFTTQPPVLVL